MSSTATTTVHGIVEALWATDRGLFVRLNTESQSLKLYVYARRSDFIAQLELAKFALTSNQDQEVREANGYRTLARTELWAIIDQHKNADRSMKVIALGVTRAGGRSPFEDHLTPVQHQSVPDDTT